MTEVPSSLEFRLTGKQFWKPVLLPVELCAGVGLLFAVVDGSVATLGIMLLIGAAFTAFLHRLLRRMYLRLDAEGVSSRMFRARSAAWPTVSGFGEGSYAQASGVLHVPALHLKDGSAYRLPAPRSDSPTYREDLQSIRAFAHHRISRP
ncbi:hypothetical protein EDD29_6066 [Actinocorallia herbida]|uniref:Uncharacterized protein n=1 Tax=Actinocorallia herbida TaxID=58109 RepID=A0A3N1D4F1_9ACTN|nr:hypothetical protein [Actinocorallia herbida]ROO88397.1 hypothetical protein EDD29_6066 [Actinocorallia herbida]